MGTLLLIIRATAGGALSVIRTVHDGLELIGAAGSAVMGVLGMVYDTVTGIGNAIVGMVTDIASTITDVLVSAIEYSTDAWLTFEKQTSQIFSLVANDATDTFQSIQAEAFRVSNSLGKDIEGVMESMRETMSAGFRTAKEGGQVVQAAGKLAQVGWEDTDVAIEAVITALHAYGLEASKAEQVSALLFETQIQGRGSTLETARLLGNVLPIAAAYSISMEDAAAATAGATLIMGGSGRTMTSVVASMTQLVKPTRDMQKAWDKYGFSVSKSANGNIDLKKTFEDLRRIRATQGDGVIGEMFGNQAAVRGVGALTKLTDKQFNELFDSIRDGKGSMDDLNSALDATEQTFGRAIERVTTVLKNLGIATVDVFANAIKPVLEDLRPLFMSTLEAFEELGNTGIFDKLRQELAALVATMRSSSVYQDILAGIQAGLAGLLNLIPALVNFLHEVNTQGRALAFFEEVGAMWTDLINQIQIGVGNWKLALEAMWDAASQIFGLSEDGLTSIGAVILDLATVKIPLWIAQLKGVNIAGVLAEWLEMFVVFRQSATDTFFTVGDSLLGILIQVLPQLKLMYDISNLAVRSLLVAFSALATVFTAVALPLNLVLTLLIELLAVIVKIIKLGADLADFAYPFAGDNPFKGMSSSLGEIETFLVTMGQENFSFAIENLKSSWSGLATNIEGANAALDNFDRPLDVSGLQNAQAALAGLKEGAVAQASSPDDPVNKMLAYLQQQAVQYEQEQVNQKANEAASAEAAAVSAEVLATQNAELNARILGALGGLQAANAAHAAQLASQAAAIAQLNSMMTQ